MKTKMYAVYFILGMLLLSCQAKQDFNPKSFPDVGISQENLNQDIIVYAPEGWGQSFSKDSITLEVIANKKDLISFNPDDVKIFINKNDGWQEINNSITSYTPDFEYILDSSKNDDPAYMGATSILPTLDDADLPANLRVFVFGYIIRNGQKTNQKVGAFVDIVYK